MESQVELSERSVRFMKLLPVGSDRELILLKGHLLIEEVITEICVASLNSSNPVGINIGSNTMFAQKLNICWALNHDRLADNIWCALKELNSIRNAMAHQIEPKGIDEKITSFVQKILSNSGFRAEVLEGKELACCIGWLHIHVSQCLHTVKNS